MWRDFLGNPWQAKYSLPLIVINFFGSIYGYYWYHLQLAATPLKYWLFVPDSPLASTLVTLALAAYLAGWRSPLFQTLSFTASIKYGIWAVLLISQFWLSGAPPAVTEAMLWLSHLGMAVEGYIYMRKVSLTWPVVVVTGLWMALNDVMDYGLGLHPYLFAADQLFFAETSAVALSAVICLLLAVRCWTGVTRIRDNMGFK